MRVKKHFVRVWVLGVVLLVAAGCVATLLLLAPPKWSGAIGGDLLIANVAVGQASFLSAPPPASGGGKASSTGLNYGFQKKSLYTYDQYRLVFGDLI